jgi:hypothetical protein
MIPLKKYKAKRDIPQTILVLGLFLIQYCKLIHHILKRNNFRQLIKVHVFDSILVQFSCLICQLLKLFIRLYFFPDPLIRGLFSLPFVFQLILRNILFWSIHCKGYYSIIHILFLNCLSR